MDPHDGDLEGHDFGGSGVEAKTLGGVMAVWPVRSAGGLRQLISTAKPLAGCWRLLAMPSRQSPLMRHLSVSSTSW